MDATDPGRIGGPIVIPNCILVRLKWLMADGRTAFNVLHGQVAGGFTVTAAIATAIHTALTTGGGFSGLAAYLFTATQLTAVELIDLRTANNPVVDSTSAAGVGLGAGVPLAPQTALVVTERTAQAGPGFRGRAYIPGWSSVAQGAGQVAVAGCVTNLGVWAQTIPTALTASGLTLCLAHPARAAYNGETGTAHAARAAATVPVTQLVVRNGQWDTQRRRGGRT